LRTASSLLVLLTVAACATLDKDECRTADWYAIGLEDGAHGRAIERLGDHRRACAKHNVSPNAERYAAGRKEGLMSFCTYHRGFAEGRAGRPNGAVCPEPWATSFAGGYQRGRELHELHRQLSALESEIARSKKALIDGIPNPYARANEIQRLEALTREAQSLQWQIQQAER
jgi:hypothetical protein